MRPSIRDVIRMIVLCECPRQLTRDDAVTWLRRVTADITGSEVAAARLIELESVSLRWGRAWDWLIEIEFKDARAIRQVVGESAWVALLADLRLLGMRPSVAVADPARVTSLGPAG